MEVAIDTVIVIMLTIIIVVVIIGNSFKTNHRIYSQEQIAKYNIINKLYYKAVNITIASISRKSKKDFKKEIYIQLKV